MSLWSRRRRRLVGCRALACAAVTLCAAATQPAFAEDLASTTLSSSVSALNPLAPQGFALSPPSSPELVKEQLRAYEAEQARLRSPAADARRKASRAQFGGLRASDALAAAKDHFPQIVNRPLWAGPRLSSDEHIVSYPDDYSARIGSSKHKEYALVESTLPLRITDNNGDKMPVSVALSDKGGYYAPENVAVETQLGKDGKTDFVKEGFAFSPVGDTDQAPQLTADKLYFPNISTDTDYMVGAKPNGAEAFFVLRSPQATETPASSIDLAPGQALKLLGDRSGAARIVDAGGKTVADIRPPAAVDALGESVPASYEVDGNKLVVAVPHADKNFAYPILVDPQYVADNQLFGGWGNPSGWTGQAGQCCYNTDFISGRIYAYPTFPNTCCYAQSSWGQWRYKAPPNTYIFRLEFSDVGNYALNNQCVAEGMQAMSGDTPVAWDGNTSLRCNGNWTGLYDTICASANCAWSASYNNQAAMQAFTPTYGAVAGGAYANGALVYIMEYYAPYVSASGMPSGGSGWFNNTQVGTGGTTVHDDGTGAKIATTKVTNPYNGTVEFSQTKAVSCAGFATSLCPNDWNPGFSNAAAGLSEGVHNVDITVSDAVQNTGSWSGQLKIDNTPPDVTINTDGGASTLFDGREQYLDKTSYTLSVTADDYGPSSADNVAGVGNFSLTIDGTTLNPAAGSSCTRGSDDCTLNWTINPYNYAPGHHNVQLNVTDDIGPGPYNYGVATPGSTMSFGFYSVLGTLTSPTQGTVVGKRLTLSTTLRSGSPSGVNVKFQYGANATNCTSPTWTDVPLSFVKDARGNTLTSWPALRPDGTSPPLVWDVAGTSGLTNDQKLCVRAVFSGNQSGPSQVGIVPLDRTSPGSDRATAPIGPGSIDLLTGNFSYSATDVEIESPVNDLLVSRTFNSRAPGTTPDANSPLGPGWKLNVPVPDAASDYQKLDAANLTLSPTTNTGYVTLTLSDGGQVSFQRMLSNYVPDPGFENLKLVQQPASATSIGAVTEFDLTDESGNTVLFKPTSATEFRPTAVAQAAGSGTETSYKFTLLGGVSRPIRALAPVPADITSSSCTSIRDSGPSTSLPIGCRMLEFVYAPVSTAPPGAGQTGDYANRLKEIDLIAAAAGATAGTFTMQTTAVARYEYDSNGRLAAAWDPRISSAVSDCTGGTGSTCATLKETYTYDSGGRLQTITPPGLNAWSMAYTTVSPDPSGGRLASVSRNTPIYTGSSVAAAWTVDYNVALTTGAGGPYQLDATELDKWGQKDVPYDATAIRPPNATTGASSPITEGTVYYLNAAGKAVNVAEPGGDITTTEYDSHNNAIRELTADNRECALSTTCATWAGSGSAAKAAALDTDRTYQPNNTDVKEEWGPLHKVGLSGGGTDYARRHVVNTYDYSSAPAPSTDYHLVTKTEVSALVGTSDVDKRTTNYRYDGADSGGTANAGWRLRKPTSVITDPSGLALERATTYNANTGLVTARRMPRNASGTSDASTKQTLYYVSGTSANGCGSRAGWDGMVCKTTPADTSPTPNLPALVVSTYEYDQFGHETKQTDTSGTATRTTTTTYDAAGRRASEDVVGVGSDIPQATYTYSAATGLPTTTAAGGKTITKAYDGVGRTTSYTDGDSQAATTDYDARSRAHSRNDGKGTQTYTYDTSIEPRGLVTNVADSQAGSFDARYDADGQQTNQTYPNGLTACTTYDESGDAVELAYVKGGCASPTTTWIDDKQTSSIHGQWLVHDSSGQLVSHQDYSYDQAGRIDVVKDTKNTQCTVRDYDYAGLAGMDSNRTKLTVFNPAGDGSCQTATPDASKSRDYAYDAADRETDFGYDAFGRTTQIPATYAGGTALGTSSSPLTYYENDLIASVTQGSETRSFALDPARRVRQRTATDGNTNSNQLYHYADDSDSPSWTQDKLTGGNPPYTRNVEGLNGDLVALVVSGTTTLQLTNLHGDTVATASTSTTATGPSSTMEADEFGVPRSTVSSATRYGWLGRKERRTELGTGAIAMGVRLYVPQLGRFAQVDPVAGGSANDYDYVDQDPVNSFDLDGRTKPRPEGGRCRDCARQRADRTGQQLRGDVRMLWGTGTGKFRTKGRYATTTMRG